MLFAGNRNVEEERQAEHAPHSSRACPKSAEEHKTRQLLHPDLCDSQKVRLRMQSESFASLFAAAPVA